MKYEILLNADEVKELKKELISTYTMMNGKAPTDKWLNNTIVAMLSAYAK